MSPDFEGETQAAWTPRAGGRLALGHWLLTGSPHRAGPVLWHPKVPTRNGRQIELIWWEHRDRVRQAYHWATVTARVRVTVTVTG